MNRSANTRSARSWVRRNLARGLYACGFGLVIVAIFLICYYYLAGVVATIAVFMNVVLILGVLAAFGATFTLPGIAGIVLTIGAAVDANVLIFERLREEQHAGTEPAHGDAERL